MPFYEDLIQVSDLKLIHVNLDQFYGIEINDFAVSVAKTALWIAESQMFEETMNIIDFKNKTDFFPLTSNTNIKEMNALKADWEQEVPKDKLTYIIGNPPFSGARTMKDYQKKELVDVFGKSTDTENLDYVTCWFKKAADYIEGTDIRCALVATNSICQGIQVDPLWRPLLESGIHIDFAYRPFLWDSQAINKAHVYCVIVGFSRGEYNKPKYIFEEDKKPIVADNINAYLLNKPNIFLEQRRKPFEGVPKITMGNQPIDNGNYIFKLQEMQDFIKAEPRSAKWFHPYYGAEDFMKGEPRYILHLKYCPPEELYKMPKVRQRVKAVEKYSRSKTRAGTLKMADKPTWFSTERIVDKNYIIIPRHTSGERDYIPFGFLTPNDMASDAADIIMDGDLYHFGVLSSKIHMLWTMTFCGRIKADFRYSKQLIYNNFPWPETTPEQKAKIEKTAQKILDIRKKYTPNLKVLYKHECMPDDLRKAHESNDRAVLQAYGLRRGATDNEIMERLLEMYTIQIEQEKVKTQKHNRPKLKTRKRKSKGTNKDLSKREIKQAN